MSINKAELEDVLPSEEVVDTKTEQKEIPEKFRNKSLEDVIKSYTDLESEFGRKSNEIGELRRLTDNLLGLQLEEKRKEHKATKQITADELFEDPSRTIKQAIETHPEVQQLKDQLRQTSIDRNREKFESKHPDYRDVVASTEFQSWITNSSARTKMFIEADRNFDYDVGSELLTLYKELKSIDIKKKEDEVNKKIEEDLKNVETIKSSGREAKKKVFRRADLIQLKLNNPAQYKAMETEIYDAYKEGRVK